ncbi:MAG: hypothetical protein Q8P77_02185 [Candidatus Veblenbacteria bacterium]|nr:hypothetical protein [Candidatus Veblenbacteria bacterium]
MKQIRSDSSAMGAHELKARLLCEGAYTSEEEFGMLMEQLNPFGVKRGGLGSGAKVRLVPSAIMVNFPLYRNTKVPIRMELIDDGVVFFDGDIKIGRAVPLEPPTWYGQILSDGTPIERIFIQHGTQLATAVYEDCALFNTKEACEFCVMRFSTTVHGLRVKRIIQIIEALKLIPLVYQSRGVLLNGGMTFHAGRGMELITPVVEGIRNTFPNIPMAVEITPPQDLTWIDRLHEAGCNSLMMNLECWDEASRQKYIPGKNKACPRALYLEAFKRAVKVFGKGKVSSCFVCGTEPLATLKQGIRYFVGLGVYPSPLSGRYFEDVPGYQFTARMPWQEFLEVQRFVQVELARAHFSSTDRAGCIACGMCDMVGDREQPKI